MKQYCRYCANAIDYYGDAETFICSAKAKCGNDGAGKQYLAEKAKRINKCKYFEFNPLDVFYTSYGKREYKPRDKYEIENKPAGEQLSLFVGGKK